MLRTKQLASQVAGANRRCQQLSEEKERDLTSWRALAEARREEIEKLTARVLALEAPAAPLFATQARKFKGSLVVVLLTTPGNNRIFYTTDGSVPVTDEKLPSSSSNFGLAPLAIELTQSSVITAFCVSSGGRASEVVSEEFVLDSSDARPSSYGVSQVITCNLGRCVGLPKTRMHADLNRCPGVDKCASHCRQGPRRRGTDARKRCCEPRCSGECCAQRRACRNGREDSCRGPSSRHR